MARVGIFGGSFNPVHVGHLRMAVEVLQALDLDRVELVPAYHQPLKGFEGALDHGLRVEMVEECVAGVPGLMASGIESRLPTPSYTWRTLEKFNELMPDSRLFFLLGAEDFMKLREWNRGLELPEFADLAVMARSGIGREDVLAQSRDYWPGQEGEEEAGEDSTLLRRFAHGAGLHFVETIRMDVSASLVRQEFLARRRIDFLVPRAVISALMDNAEQARRTWSGED
jgi:nicotinate-nucleotide adenylyltransferase